MSYKARALELASALDLQVDDSEAEEITVEAPAGFRFTATGTHGLVAAWMSEFPGESRTEAWRSLLGDFRLGTERCPKGGDEDCRAAECPASRDH